VANARPCAGRSRCVNTLELVRRFSRPQDLIRRALELSWAKGLIDETVGNRLLTMSLVAAKPASVMKTGR
jgi:hypothetical protein